MFGDYALEITDSTPRGQGVNDTQLYHVIMCWMRVCSIFHVFLQLSTLSNWRCRTRNYSDNWRSYGKKWSAWKCKNSDNLAPVVCYVRLLIRHACWAELCGLVLERKKYERLASIWRQSMIPGVGIPIIKIRWSIMGIPILVRWHFHIENSP